MSRHKRGGFTLVELPGVSKRGFTLVELLVVIGIIAVLIGILMPALSRARESARIIKCASNLRVIAQASISYSIDNKNCFLPSIIYKDVPDGNGNGDWWAHLLMYGKYLPRQNIENGNSPPPFDSVLICPSVQRENIQANSPSDGIREQASVNLEPGTLWAAISYGINGTSYSAVASQHIYNKFYPCTAISLGQAICDPLKKRNAAKKSSELVFMFDGKEWNIWTASGSNNLIRTRIAGQRHGGWSNTRPDSSGRVNVSFMDGHVQTIPRKQLPDEANAPAVFTSPDPYFMNTYFPFPKWRLDQ